MVQKEERTPVFIIDSCNMLEIKKIKLSFNEKGNVVLLKCKTSHVRISYSPNSTQIESFFYFFSNIGFPPDASNLKSKIKLKSPSKIISLLL